MLVAVNSVVLRMVLLAPLAIFFVGVIGRGREVGATAVVDGASSYATVFLGVAARRGHRGEVHAGEIRHRADTMPSTSST